MWWRNNLTLDQWGASLKARKETKQSRADGEGAPSDRLKRRHKTWNEAWRKNDHKVKEKKAEAETEEETNHAASREEERDGDEALQRSMKGASIIQQL